MTLQQAINELSSGCETTQDVYNKLKAEGIELDINKIIAMDESYLCNCPLAVYFTRKCGQEVTVGLSTARTNFTGYVELGKLLCTFRRDFDGRVFEQRGK